MDAAFLEFLEIPVALCEPDTYLVTMANSRFWEEAGRNRVVVPIQAIISGFKEEDFLRCDLVGETYRFPCPGFGSSLWNFLAREVRIGQKYILFQALPMGGATEVRELRDDELAEALLASGEETVFLATIQADQALYLARVLGNVGLEMEALRWLEEASKLMRQQLFQGFLVTFTLQEIDMDTRMFSRILQQEVSLYFKDSSRNFRIEVNPDVPPFLKGPFPFIHLVFQHFFKELSRSSDRTSDLLVSVDQLSQNNDESQVEFTIHLPDDPVDTKVLDRMRDLSQVKFTRFVHQARSEAMLWVSYLVRSSEGLIFCEEANRLRVQWTLTRSNRSLAAMEEAEPRSSATTPQLASSPEPSQPVPSQIPEPPIEQPAPVQTSPSESNNESASQLNLNSKDESFSIKPHPVPVHSGHTQHENGQQVLPKVPALQFDSQDSPAPAEAPMTPKERLLKTKALEIQTPEESHPVEELPVETPVSSAEVQASQEANEPISTAIEKEPSKADPIQGTAIKILVAEDNRMNQQIFAQILKREGYEYKICNNGEEVVQEVSESPYHLILMDLQMPVMNGFEATKIIRDREQSTGRRIPIIAVSANILEEDRGICLQAGMDAFVSKPIHRGELLEAIRENALRP